jgi:peptidoglycan/LPS O-acetylase OafA/YrhL
MTDPYSRFLEVRRFGSLDGLRCLSIVAVLWHHSGIPHGLGLLSQGQVGVHLFFAISGFLITSLMIRERIAHGSISLPQFYVRRSLRIFPLYYAVLLAYTVLVWAVEEGPARQQFFANLPAFATYTTHWFVSLDSERVIFYFAWSLAVEEQFYLTWPWIERYARERSRMLILGAIFAVVAALHFGLLSWLLPTNSVVYSALWHMAPAILFGVLFAHMLHHPRGFALLWKGVGGKWAAPALLVVILSLLALPAIGMGVHYVVYAALALLVVSCVVREDNGLGSVLRWPPAVRFGVTSYGIYLMHMLCFNVVERLGTAVGVQNLWALWLGGVLLVYLLAEISFHTFERFFLQRKARFERLVAGCAANERPTQTSVAG